jgi:heptosyltransferase II
MKILLVAPSWVGDMVMAHSLVQLLANNCPAARIDVLAPPASLPLAGRMPEVSASLNFPFAHGELAWRRRRALARELRGTGYDWAIVLPNSLKSALVPWWAKIPRRTGWLGEQRYLLLNDHRRLDPVAYPLMFDRFLALGLPAGAALPVPRPVPRLQVDSAATEGLAQELGLSLAGPVLGLCPGAEFGPAKRWPPEHFAVVAAHWLGHGGQVWLFGGPGDRAATAEILAALPAAARAGVRDLAGRTSLTQALDLLSRCTQVVSNDSGLMHLACAAGRPVIALFGSTSPNFTPPLGDDAQVLRLNLDCSPCFQRECPLGHLNCLRQLEPALVLQHLQVSA